MTSARSLILSTGVLAGILIASSILSSMAVQKLGNELNEANSRGARRMALVGDIQGLSGKLRGAVRGVILYAPTRMSRPEMLLRSSSEFHKFSLLTNQVSSELGSLESTEAAKTAARKQRQAVSEWQPVLGEIERLCRSGAADRDLKVWVTRSIQAADKLDAATAELKSVEVRLNEDAALRGKAIQAGALWTELIGLLVGIMAAGLVLHFELGMRVDLRRLSKDIADGPQHAPVASH